MRVIDVADNRDWMDEFPPESPPNTRLLAGATTLPIITSKAPPSGHTTGRRRAHRSILLMVSAIAVMISASTVVFGLWMRVALTPVPIPEWPVSAPPPSSSPASVPNPALAALAPAAEPQPTPEPVPEPAASPAPAASIPSTPARTAPRAVWTPSPALAAEPPAALGTSDVSAILSVLERYRQEFRSLNPGSVRAVAFDNCRIDVQGAQAGAVCVGRVSLVTAAGSQVRNIQSRRWTFTLAHGRDAWRIQAVDIE